MTIKTVYAPEIIFSKDCVYYRLFLADSLRLDFVLETIYITKTLLEAPLSLKVICMETFSFRDFHNFCKFANLTREFTYCMQS